MEKSRPVVTSFLIEKIKQEAFKKESGTYTQMLDKLAKEYGFDSWHQVNKLYKKAMTNLEEFTYSFFNFETWKEHIDNSIINERQAPLCAIIAPDVWPEIVADTRLAAIFDPTTKIEIVRSGILGNLKLSNGLSVGIYTDLFRLEHHKILKEGEIWILDDACIDDIFTEVTHREDFEEVIDDYIHHIIPRLSKKLDTVVVKPILIKGTRIK